MRIRYIKDFVGHSKGDIIDTDKSTAEFLIKKEVCELEILPITDIEEVEKVIKKRGNPNFGKK